MNCLWSFLFSLSVIAVRAQGVAAPTGTTSSLDAYWNLPGTSGGSTQAVLTLNGPAVPAPTSALNQAILSQTGSNNTALLSVLSGSQNRLEANQSSNGNGANVSLTGGDNSILLNQTGGGNTVSLGLTGNSNRFLFTQDGGDAIQMQGVSQSNARLELTQGSGNNSFTANNSPLLINGTGISNLRIEQSGGASITVQQGQLIGGIKP